KRRGNCRADTNTGKHDTSGESATIERKRIADNALCARVSCRFTHSHQKTQQPKSAQQTYSAREYIVTSEWCHTRENGPAYERENQSALMTERVTQPTARNLKKHVSDYERAEDQAHVNCVNAELGSNGWCG